MDEWIGLLVGLLFWRTVLVTGLGLVAAMGLAALFPSIHGGLFVVMVLVAFGGGLLWHGRTTEPASDQPGLEEVPMSAPVAFLGLMFIGFSWGGLLELLIGVPLVVATLLLLSPFLFAPVLAWLTRRRSAMRAKVFGSVAMIAGYAVPYIIFWLF